MQTVTLSSKFQVVIPKLVREDLDLKAGQKLVVLEDGNSVVLVRIGDIRKARGMAKGVTTEGLRDERDRFN